MRRLAGYDRYDSKAALEALNGIHAHTHLYVNFFWTVMQLLHKSRHGARVHKVYHPAQTPYQRLQSAGILSGAKAQELAAIYHHLNRALLLRQINDGLERSWDLARHPTTQTRKGKTRQASMTGIMRQSLPVR